MPHFHCYYVTCNELFRLLFEDITIIMMTLYEASVARVVCERALLWLLCTMRWMNTHNRFVQMNTQQKTKNKFYLFEIKLDRQRQREWGCGRQRERGGQRELALAEHSGSSGNNKKYTKNTRMRKKRVIKRMYIVQFESQVRRHTRSTRPSKQEQVAHTPRCDGQIKWSDVCERVVCNFVVEVDVTGARRVKAENSMNSFADLRSA